MRSPRVFHGQELNSARNCRSARASSSAECRLLNAECLIISFAIARGDRPGEIRQGLIGNDRARIAFDERIGDLLSADFRGGVARTRENGHALLHIVRIGRQHMHSLTFEQPLRGTASALTPETGEGRAGDLNDAPLLGEFDDAFKIFAQNRITLGMRNNRRQPVIAQFEQRIGGRLRNAVIAELNQHVARVPDGVASGMRHRVLDVLIRKMKVAAEQKLWLIPDFLLQFVQQVLEMFAIIRIAVVGVRRGDHVGDAIGRGSFADFDRNVPRFGPVIYVRQNVRMNIDHFVRKSRRESGSALFKLTLDLNRFARKEKDHGFRT